MHEWWHCVCSVSWTMRALTLICEFKHRALHPASESAVHFRPANKTILLKYFLIQYSTLVNVSKASLQWNKIHLRYYLGEPNRAWNMNKSPTFHHWPRNKCSKALRVGSIGKYHICLHLYNRINSGWVKI